LYHSPPNDTSLAVEVAERDRQRERECVCACVRRSRQSHLLGGCTWSLRGGLVSNLTWQTGLPGICAACSPQFGKFLGVSSLGRTSAGGRKGRQGIMRGKGSQAGSANTKIKGMLVDRLWHLSPARTTNKAYGNVHQSPLPQPSGSRLSSHARRSRVRSGGSEPA